MHKIKFLIVILGVILFTIPVFAQDEGSPVSNVISTEAKLEQLLADLEKLHKQLRKGRNRSNKVTARKIRLITRKIIRAVNSAPPSSCLDKLKVAMDDFYGLTTDLGTGISCGPSILPPFLERKEPEPLTTNCLPPEDELLAQIDSPFSEVYGLYNQARDLFHIDVNTNEIPDSCE